MPRILMAYSTVDGQTLKICGRIQQMLEAAGCTVTLFDIDSDKACDLAPLDTIVICASIRYGQHRPNVYHFIESNRVTLDRKPNAFFSVNVVARKVGKDSPTRTCRPSGARRPGRREKSASSRARLTICGTGSSIGRSSGSSCG